MAESWKKDTFANMQDVATAWTKVGGAATYLVFVQAGILEGMDKMVRVTKSNGDIVEVDVKGGICNALVHRFIDNRFKNLTVKKNVDNLIAEFGREKIRQANMHAGVIPWLETEAGHKYQHKTGVALRVSRAVGSRAKLVEIICKESHLWLYKITNGKKQHSVGIDCRNKQVHFFDPEWGYFYTDMKPVIGSDEELAFKKLLYGIWNSNEHKQRYKSGGRWLYEFA